LGDLSEGRSIHPPNHPHIDGRRSLLSSFGIPCPSHQT
jgi:hypothetical protein